METEIETETQPASRQESSTKHRIFSFDRVSRTACSPEQVAGFEWRQCNNRRRVGCQKCAQKVLVVVPGCTERPAPHHTAVGGEHRELEKRPITKEGSTEGRQAILHPCRHLKIVSQMQRCQIAQGYIEPSRIEQQGWR